MAERPGTHQELAGLDMALLLKGFEGGDVADDASGRGSSNSGSVPKVGQTMSTNEMLAGAGSSWMPGHAGKGPEPSQAASAGNMHMSQQALLGSGQRYPPATAERLLAFYQLRQMQAAQQAQAARQQAHEAAAAHVEEEQKTAVHLASAGASVAGSSVGPTGDPDESGEQEQEDRKSVV